MVEKEIEAEREPSTGFDDTTVGQLDAYRLNRRAGIAVVTGFEAVGDEVPPEEVRLRFDFPHGEASFTQTFPLSSPLSSDPTLDDLLREVGLEPGVDSIAELDGAEVSVTDEGRGDWRVEVDDKTGTRASVDTARVTALRPIVSALGLVSILATVLSPVATAAGIIGLFSGSAAVFLLLFPLLTLIAEAAYVGLGFLAYDVPGEGPDMLGDYHEYFDSGDASVFGLLVLLLTAGTPILD